jgi:hypothetical protein
MRARRVSECEWPACGAIAYNRKRILWRPFTSRSCGSLLDWSTFVNRWNLCKTIVLSAALAASLAVAPLKAQAPATQSLAQAPAAQPAPAAQTSPSGHPNNAYWIEHDKQLLVDFGGLERFKEANAMLTTPQPGENRLDHAGMEAG